jgi:transcriptional regulator with XRE-family HTH domain
MDLKTARSRKNMTQVELGKLINVTDVMISNYEQGKSIPRPATRRRIEDFLGPVTWPDSGQPLSVYEHNLVFNAMGIAAERLGSLEDAIAMFSDKGPDELRRLVKAIGSEDELLLPPGVEE